ncbi:MAG: histidine phosphatase family protein [Lentisphaeria bacterium]|nr:histidine phosphatase family protein [Lentisphaeria bacterium]
MANERKIFVGLMRHGQAGTSPDGDFARPLTPRGVHDVEKVAAAAAGAGFAPGWIITSAAERARRTAELFQTAAGTAGGILYENDLYLCSAETIWRHIATGLLSGFKALLIVGHNPGISQAAALLSGDSGDRVLRTADLLVFEGDYDLDVSLAPSLFRQTATLRRPHRS